MSRGSAGTACSLKPDSLPACAVPAATQDATEVSKP